MNGTFDLDEHGFPLLLAPGSARAPVIDDLADPTIPVRSGNAHRAPKGRFGTGDTRQVVAKPSAPVAPSADEAGRREDAVREAAREFETFKRQDLIEWLRGRINRPFSDAEVAQFEKDVRAQQLTDIGDVLDQMVRGTARGRRYVKVMAPRGYVRKTLNSLTDEELLHLGQRLRARGWSEAQLKTGLAERLGLDRRNALSSLVSPKT